MDQLIEHINALIVTNGTKAKKEYLSKILTSKDYQKYFKYTYDTITYKFNTIKLPKIKKFSGKDYNVLEILETLAKGEISGNKKEDYLKKMLSKSTEGNYTLLQMALRRNLRIGLNAKSINEVVGYTMIKHFTVIKPRGALHKHIKYPCYVDFKYNGRRLCMERENNTWRLLESGGGELKSSDITKELDILIPKDLGDIRLDSELQSSAAYYGLDGGDYLDDSHRLIAGRIVSKYKSTDKEIPKEELQKLEVVVFDIVPLDHAYAMKSQAKSETLRSRRKQLRKIFRGKKLNFVKRAYWKRVRDRENLIKYYSHVVRKGGEGIIWKNRDSLYFSDLTNEWGKVKHTVTVDLEITGVKYAKAGSRDEGKLNTLLCESKDRKLSVFVSSGIRKEEIGDGLKDLIGKIIEIKFVNTITSTKEKGKYSLFNPSFVSGVYGSLRDDKHEALTLDEILIAEKEALYVL